MFHHATSPRSEHAGLKNNPFLRRAALFGGALLLLFVALQLLPSSPPDPAHLYSDGLGTVASKPQSAEAAPRPESTFRPGYFFALALLAGGGAFALYLRKRNGPAGPSNMPLRTVGALQLEPGQQLRLVACGEEILLLGVTSSQITLLKSFPADTFDDTDGVNPTPILSTQSGSDHRLPSPTAGSSFAAVLQHFSTASSQTRQSAR